MKNLTNILLVILIVVTLGLYVKTDVVKYVTNTVTTGAIGDTNTTPRMIQTSIDVSTTTPLSLSNTSGADRLVTSINYYVSSSSQAKSNATGLAALTWIMSTSTGVYTADSTNYILNTTIGTTTSLYVATTSPGNSQAATTSRVWANGTNLNLFQNGTSTASGVYFVVQYLQL